MALSIFGDGTAIFAAEQNNSPTNNGNEQITPYYIAVASHTNYLKLNSSEKLTCESNTEVRYGYIAGITMELQEKESGVWSTIKTWSNEDSSYIDLSKSYYVE